MKRLLRSKSDFRLTTERNMLTSLLLFEHVTTTKPQAKRLISVANHFFNQVRSKSPNAYRLAHQTLTDKNAVKKLFEDIIGRYQEGETTFVTSLKLMPRRGDNAEMTLVKLIRDLASETKPKAKTEKVTKKVENA